METASKAEAIRLPYLDYLRVMAAAAVIMIHVSAQNWDNVPVMSSDWIIFNLYNSLAQWAVPMFLMLSGALMLDPGKPFKSARCTGKISCASSPRFCSGLRSMPWTPILPTETGAGRWSLLSTADTICGFCL